MDFLIEILKSPHNTQQGSFFLRLQYHKKSNSIQIPYNYTNTHKILIFVDFPLLFSDLQGFKKQEKTIHSKQIRFNLIPFHPSMPRQLAKICPSPVAARVLRRQQSLATCSCSWSNVPDSWDPSNAALVRHLHPPSVASFLNPADDVVVPFRPKRHCPKERRLKGDSVVSGAWLLDSGYPAAIHAKMSVWPSPTIKNKGAQFWLVKYKTLQGCTWNDIAP